MVKVLQFASLFAVAYGLFDLHLIEGQIKAAQSLKAADGLLEKSIISAAKPPVLAVSPGLQGGYIRKSLESLFKDTALKPNTKLDSIVEVPEQSVKRQLVSLEKESITQTSTGSCHIFATATLLRDATGLRISKARLFLDHIIRNGFDTMMLSDALKYSRRGPFCSKPIPNGWEGGTLKKDLDLMKRVGGVIVPHDDEFRLVEDTLKRVKEKRNELVKKGRLWNFVEPSKVEKQLGEAGIEKLKSMASSNIDLTGRNIDIDRLMVKMAIDDLKVASLEMGELESPLQVQQRITSLVNVLDQNAIYAAVEFDRYMQSLKGKLKVKFPFHNIGDHAVAIVGFEVESNTFLIKDSNFAKILTVDANQFVQSIDRSYILKK